MKTFQIKAYGFENKSTKVIEIPFFEYLEKYAILPQDTVLQREKKRKQVANIYTHLQYLADHKGSYYLPPIIEAYKQRKVGMVKINEANCLIRIAFFTTQDKIIVLDVLEKPKRYEKAKKQQVDKAIQEFLDKTEHYMRDYQSHPISVPIDLKQ
jgi:hypothetical protein